MSINRSLYRRGVFLKGGPVLNKATGPVVYGKPLEKPTANLAEIEARLDQARKRLEEIAAAVRR